METFIIAPNLPVSTIALHGMENRIKEYACTLKGSKRDNMDKLSLIRSELVQLMVDSDLEALGISNKNKSSTAVTDKAYIRQNVVNTMS